MQLIAPCEGPPLKVAMLYQQLLLQKPYKAPDSSFVKCLQKRIESWDRGQILDLLKECRTIQTQLGKHHSRTQLTTDHNVDGKFADLVTNGKLSSALRLLDPDSNSPPMHLDDRVGDSTILDVLKDKHPQQEPLLDDTVIKGELHPKIKTSWAVEFWTPSRMVKVPLRSDQAFLRYLRFKLYFRGTRNDVMRARHPPKRLFTSLRLA